MFKQHSNRHQRSKGFKLKHVLQICVLVAVCIWLLYQVKHSHDKKKEFEERNSSLAGIPESDPRIMKFGRKDLPNVNNDDVAGKDSHEEEENEVEEDEHDLRKDAGEEEEDRGDGTDESDENEQEKDEDSKGAGEDGVDENDRENGEGIGEDDENDQENDEEGKGAGVDALDENDQENNEEGKGVGGDELDENIKEMVGELGDDEENEVKSDKLFRTGNDNEDDDETDSREAREQHYKGDDASSAVVKNAETLQSEEDHQGRGKEDEENIPEESNGDEANGNGDAHKVEESGDNSWVVDDSVAMHDQVDTVLSNNSSLNVINDVAEDADHMNATHSNSTIPELSEIMKPLNSTSEAVSNHAVEKIAHENSTTVLEMVTKKAEQLNSTAEAVSNHTVEEDGKIAQENSTAFPEMVPEGMSLKNETMGVVLDGGQNLTTNAKILTENKTLESENNSIMNVGDATIELTEKTNMAGTAGDSEDASNDSLMVDDIEAVLNDTGELATDDNSESATEGAILDDEKDVQTDLSTLPDTEMDTTVEDMAAE